MQSGGKMSKRKKSYQDNTSKTKGLAESYAQSGSYNQIIQQMGFNIGNFDYTKAESTLAQIAAYNVWAAASIRAILRNSIQPILKIWNPVTQEDVTAPEYLQIFRKPNPFMNYSDFIKFQLFSQLFYGESYSLKVRVGQKMAGISPIPWAQISRYQDAHGVKYFLNGIGAQEIQTNNLIKWHDKNYGDSYFSGTASVKHLIFAITEGNYSDRYNIKSFENGGEIRGFLKTDQTLIQSDVEMMQKQWKDRYGGPDNAQKTPILGKGTDFVQTGQTNADMGYEALKKISREEVLAIFKVPPAELGLFDSINYSNAKEQRRLFWETTMMPTLADLASAWTEQILWAEYNRPDLEYYFDFSGISALQDDLEKKLTSAMRMQAIGYDLATVAEYLELPTPNALESAQSLPDAPKTIKMVADIPAKYKSAYRDQIKGSFLLGHAAAEKPFVNAIEKHILNMRNEMSDALRARFAEKALADDIEIFVKDYFSSKMPGWNRDLEKTAKHYFAVAEDQIVKRMIAEYGLEYLANANQTIITGRHVREITNIHETIRKQVEAAVTEAILTETGAGGSVYNIADQIIADTRGVFDIAKKRAVLIARTETTSLANDMLADQFEANGVEEKEWLTAGDEQVRGDPSGPNDDAEFRHDLMDGVIVGVNDYFTVPKRLGGHENMKYPGDMTNGSAGNVCNCRCTMMPV
jgi:HK97 family phage portal protein